MLSPCEYNPPTTAGFPLQRASNEEFRGFFFVNLDKWVGGVAKGWGWGVVGRMDGGFAEDESICLFTATLQNICQ